MSSFVVCKNTPITIKRSFKFNILCFCFWKQSIIVRNKPIGFRVEELAPSSRYAHTHRPQTRNQFRNHHVLKGKKASTFFASIFDWFFFSVSFVVCASCLRILFGCVALFVVYLINCFVLISFFHWEINKNQQQYSDVEFQSWKCLKMLCCSTTRRVRQFDFCF